MLNIMRWCFIGITVISVLGCASQKVGLGTVVSEAKVADKNYKPQKSTLVGAGVGAVGGASAGVILGTMAATTLTAATLLTAATFPFSVPFVPIAMVAGTAIGAVGGGATGAGVGYAVDQHKQGVGLYQYIVKPDNQAETIVVTQYVQKPIAVNSRVLIKMKDKQYFIVEVQSETVRTQRSW